MVGPVLRQKAEARARESWLEVPSTQLSLSQTSDSDSASSSSSWLTSRPAAHSKSPHWRRLPPPTLQLTSAFSLTFQFPCPPTPLEHRSLQCSGFCAVVTDQIPICLFIWEWERRDQGGVSCESTLFCHFTVSESPLLRGEASNTLRRVASGVRREGSITSVQRETSSKALRGVEAECSALRRLPLPRIESVC